MAITALPTPPLRTDPTNFSERADAFMAALPVFVTETNEVAAAMNLNSVLDTSATSNTIGVTSLTFTVSTGKSFLGGMYLIIADTAAPSANSLFCQVASYNTGTGVLIVDVISIRGSGTKTAWLISLATAGGAQAGANTDITALSGLIGGYAKNKLINPNFAINQRYVSGTVVLAAGVYGHDRFKAGAGGCTYTFATSLNVTTITISAGTLMQVIEGNNLFSGTHTLSWVGTATARIDSGSYGASGITGTAVGGTNQTCEWSTGTVSKVQYEEGAVATVFEKRLKQQELRLCQYYLPSWDGTYVGTGQAYTAGGLMIFLACPVTPRVAPTGIVHSGVNYLPSTAVFGNGAGLSGLTIFSGSLAGVVLNGTGGSGLVAGDASMLNLGGVIYATGCEL